MPANAMVPHKAADSDFLGRFREVISDPLNLLIERVPLAGIVEGNEVYLHNGNRVPVSGRGAYYGPFSQLLVVNRGVHEPLEEYVFQEALKSLPASPLMIELGCYWAHYSMWLKKERSKAIAIMIEPDPNNLAAGQANFSRNGFHGDFVQAAVAKGEWELDPFLTSRGIAHVNILHVDRLHMLTRVKSAVSYLSLWLQKITDRIFNSYHIQRFQRKSSIKSRTSNLTLTQRGAFKKQRQDVRP